MFANSTIAPVDVKICFLISSELTRDIYGFLLSTILSSHSIRARLANCPFVTSGNNMLTFSIHVYIDLRFSEGKSISKMKRIPSFASKLTSYMRQDQLATLYNRLCLFGTQKPLQSRSCNNTFDFSKLCACHDCHLSRHSTRLYTGRREDFPC